MAEKDLLEYKGRPIVRKGNTLYYGNTSEKYVIMMEILSEKEIGGTKVADRVKVDLEKTDDGLSAKEKVVKTCERIGLGKALEIAAVWLDGMQK